MDRIGELLKSLLVGVLRAIEGIYWPEPKPEEFDPMYFLTGAMWLSITAFMIVLAGYLAYRVFEFRRNRRDREGVQADDTITRRRDL